METNTYHGLLEVISSWTRMIKRANPDTAMSTIRDLESSMKFVLNREGYKPKIVKQFSIDVEMYEDDLLAEQDISNQLKEVWAMDGKQGREVVGESWKATWSSYGYHRGFEPEDSD